MDDGQPATRICGGRANLSSGARLARVYWTCPWGDRRRWHTWRRDLLGFAHEDEFGISRQAYDGLTCSARHGRDLCGYAGLDYRRASRRTTNSFVARGCSAVGSASPCQGEGRGFESRHPLEGAVASTPAVEWPSGEATACKAVHTGSIPVSTSKVSGAISSAGERFPDTEEVTGSIPVSRTTITAVKRSFFARNSDGVN